MYKENIKMLIRVLQLEPKKAGMSGRIKMYRTEFGMKTEEGLIETIAEVLAGKVVE